jgi:hypothetical protein
MGIEKNKYGVENNLVSSSIQPRLFEDSTTAEPVISYKMVIEESDINNEDWGDIHFFSKIIVYIYPRISDWLPVKNVVIRHINNSLWNPDGFGKDRYRTKPNYAGIRRSIIALQKEFPGIDIYRIYPYDRIDFQEQLSKPDELDDYVRTFYNLELYPDRKQGKLFKESVEQIDTVYVYISDELHFDRGNGLFKGGDTKVAVYKNPKTCHDKFSKLEDELDIKFFAYILDPATGSKGRDIKLIRHYLLQLKDKYDSVIIKDYNLSYGGKFNYMSDKPVKGLFEDRELIDEPPSLFTSPDYYETGQIFIYEWWHSSQNERFEDLFLNSADVKGKGWGSWVILFNGDKAIDKVFIGCWPTDSYYTKKDEGRLNKGIGKAVTKLRSKYGESIPVTRIYSTSSVTPTYSYPDYTRTSVSDDDFMFKKHIVQRRWVDDYIFAKYGITNPSAGLFEGRERLQSAIVYINSPIFCSTDNAEDLSIYEEDDLIDSCEVPMLKRVKRIDFKDTFVYERDKATMIKLIQDIKDRYDHVIVDDYITNPRKSLSYLSDPPAIPKLFEDAKGSNVYYGIRIMDDPRWVSVRYSKKLVTSVSLYMLQDLGSVRKTRDNFTFRSVTIYRDEVLRISNFEIPFIYKHSTRCMEPDVVSIRRIIDRLKKEYNVIALMYTGENNEIKKIVRSVTKEDPLFNSNMGWI